MLRFLFIPLLGMLMLLTSCQTSPVKQFSEVKAGMEKADVLSLMGSPVRAERARGQDKWTYVFYEKNIRFEKEIHFIRGNVVYVGEPVEAPVEKSAETVDKKNEITNQVADEAEERALKRKKPDLDTYEKKSKGEDKVRYLPQFEVIE